MTKKELLENEVFKALPDDAQIVTRMNSNSELYYPLSFDELTACQANGRTCLVIDAVSFHVLQEYYHIELNS